MRKNSLLSRLYEFRIFLTLYLGLGIKNQKVTREFRAIARSIANRTGSKRKVMEIKSRF